jgi:MscS family membrane protein
LVLVLGIAVIAWAARRWRAAEVPGRRLADFLVPLALTALPVVGGLMLQRLFVLPGGPAVTLELVFTVIGVAGSMWLVWLAGARLGDFAAGLGSSSARPLKRQLVRAVFRVATIVVVTGVAVKALYTFGVPVAGLVAGLGVGGLAIALAAQSTLENFIGGIILYADQPVKVGDFCRFGDRRGLVEDVGLRSTRIRTLDRTVVTIPNATFAKMELENLSGRDRILLRETIRLRYETTREQLQGVMAALEAMLREHPRISHDRLRVRFNGLAESSLEIELYAYAETGDWPEFTRIREEILLRVLEIVERSDTRLAVPTEVHYVHEQEAPQSAT